MGRFCIAFTSIFYLLSCSVTYAKTYSASLCNDSLFHCYTVKRHDTWKKLFPDTKKRDLIMRINRMNTHLYKGLKIAIPNSDNNDPLSYSPFPQQIDPPGKKIIIVSIHNLAFGAYEANGILIHWGPISAAKGYCPDIHRGCHTSLGKFYIYRKGGPYCISTKYPVGRGGAPMPYCMYFNGGFALHGSYEVPGYNDSHGCVRMFVDDAKWLNQEFTADEHKTPVIINP